MLPRRITLFVEWPEANAKEIHNLMCPVEPRDDGLYQGHYPACSKQPSQGHHC